MAGPGPDDQEPEEPGTIRPTGPGPLVGFGVTGLVLGWSVRAFALRFGYAEPRVSLASVALLVFAAAGIGATAYVTRKAVRSHRQDLPHHHAVNRLVLGKAAALAGALITGGYAGYALAQLGVSGEMADARLWRSGVAAIAAGGVTVASLLLEHACRVPPRER